MPGCSSTWPWSAVPGPAAPLAGPAEGGDLRTRASSGPPAERCDRAQWETGTGPTLDVLHTDTVVAADLAGETRWPRWSAAAVDLGVRAALAVRLHAGDRTLGALTLYAPEPQRRSIESSVGQARAVAAQLSVLVWAGDQRFHLERGLHARSRVGQAIGMIMHRDRVTADEAFALLRRTSQHRNVKIAAIVAEFLDTGVLPPSTASEW